MTRKESLLFVEDEAAILEMVGDALEDEGYEVTRASSGAKALALLNGATRST